MMQRGIVLLKVENIDKTTHNLAFSFLDRHPCLANYIKHTSHFIRLKGADVPLILNVLSRKQAEVFTQSKHVLAVKDRYCQSFYDEKGCYAIPKEMYGIRVKENTISDKVLTAIFNSAFFCFLRFHDELHKGGSRNSKYESIRNFPIPTYKLNPMLIAALERVVDCLVYCRMNKNEISLSENRMERYLRQMLDMMVFELYLPDYVREKKIAISDDFKNSILDKKNFDASIDITEVYHWFMTSENKVRQKLFLLDSRSHDLLYPIYSFSLR